jgi:hypothetical protein
MLEEHLRHYLGHGDSVLLANLIDITLVTFRSHPPNWKFHALPSLQHNFCALWNEIVLEAQNGKALFRPLSSRTLALFTRITPCHRCFP